MKFVRGHGLGNDYLVLESKEPLTAAAVVQICDRHTGVGSDGILEPTDPGSADHGVRIWNPDGSIAEKSGNGLRIFAQWLHVYRDAGHDFTVWTGHDTVRCEIQADGVRVEMGRATIEPVDVWPDSGNGDADFALQNHVGSGNLGARRAARLSIDSAPFRRNNPKNEGAPADAWRVNVGNPHCVCFVEDFLFDWRTLGAQIEVDARFPDRTNVQFARVVNGRAQARIWERGAGETQASGSSSCAVAVAAVHTGRLPAGPVSVDMPGGCLQVDVYGDQVVLTGPVELVCRIDVFAPRLLQQDPNSVP